jgi:hypothetical protein
MLSRRLAILMIVVFISGAYAVERPNPSLETRVHDADLIVVVDGIEQLPMADNEGARFHRVSARIASVLKGDAKIDERIEIVVDGTISELRNDCCVPGKSYVVFLTRDGDKYDFVGSPLGAILIEPQSNQSE